MSALRGVWERAVEQARRRAERSLSSVDRHARIEAWGKRRWAPRLTDAELLALAEANVRAAFNLLQGPTLASQWGERYRLQNRAARELAEVRNIVVVQETRS